MKYIKEKKNLIGIILILVAIISIIIGIVIYFINPTPKDKKEANIQSERIVDYCVVPNECPHPVPSTFADVTYETKNKEFNDWLEKVNKETDAYYEETKKSNTNDSACSEVKNVYKHSIRNVVNYSLYTGEKYVSVSVHRFSQNLCTGDITPIATETFIYDQENDKKTTKEELLENLNLTEKDIEKAIQNNIDYTNKTSSKKNTIEDTYKDGKLNYNIYYNSMGELIVEYYQKSDETYYSAVLK